MSRNATFDLLTQKIIMAAFCNPARTHLPVGASCRFCSSVLLGPGRPLTCENMLDPTQVSQAFELIENLYLHVNPARGLEVVNICDWAPLRAEVQRIARLLLCPQHGSQRCSKETTIETLTDHYLGAIRNVVAIELSNAQSLHKKTVDLYKARINNEYIAKPFRPSASAKSSSNSANVPQQPKTSTYSHLPQQQSYKKSYADYLYANDQSQSTHEHKRRRTNRQHPPNGHTSSSGVLNPAVPAVRPWSNIFRRYRMFWLNVENSGAKLEVGKSIDQQIVFPVSTGNAAEVTEQAVSDFLREALRSQVSGTHPADKLLYLKKERLRWHPDKIDQRFHGHLGIEKVKELAGVIIQQINGFADAEKGGNTK